MKDEAASDERAVEGDGSDSFESERGGGGAFGSEAAAHGDAVAAEGLLELFRHWIYLRHEEVQEYTVGFVVTVDYVGRRNAAGDVPCYGDYLAAQRAAIQVMHQDASAIAVPCDVERYKRALDEQLRWIEAILHEVLVGDDHCMADIDSRRHKLRSR